MTEHNPLVFIPTCPLPVSYGAPSVESLQFEPEPHSASVGPEDGHPCMCSLSSESPSPSSLG